jgi:hypothetical protein
MSGGYTSCGCPDCFEIAIQGDEDEELTLCHACEDAGCDGEGSCECEPDCDEDEDASEETPRV